MTAHTRCREVDHIALTMLDAPSGISGFYKCSIGKMECSNRSARGKFADGSITGTRLALRIAMEDGSSCLFDGNTTGANRIEGNYACYQSGILAERGSFQIQRDY